MSILHKQKAFTLVELSIVIVVIGLIVSAVVAGGAMVQAAKLHSDISKFREYKTAYSMFVDQYNGAPGDMINAIAYWGGVTANGNGNKTIECCAETLFTWQQLSLAKLTGDFAATAYPRVSSSKISTIIMFLVEDNSNTWKISKINAPNMIGTFNTVTGWNSAISPVQALAIDTKMDDGVPTKGKVTGFSSPVNDCVKEADGTTNGSVNTYQGIGSYNLAQPLQICNVAVSVYR
jgi:prepilin-type N-terminal cleavage/methylation domain-containing protein